MGDVPERQKDAEVTPLFGDPDDSPLTAKPTPPWCGHRSMTLDRGPRRVYCRDCGREVDAFDALLVLSEQRERWARAGAAAKVEAERRRRAVEELKREERNAKARLRRLGSAS